MTQRAGARNQIISIQRATQTVDDYGQPVLTWSTQATIRASRRMPTAKEREQGNKIIADCSYIFEIHKKDFLGLKSTDRIVSDGMNCEISGIMPGDERQQFVDIVCHVVNG